VIIASDHVGVIIFGYFFGGLRSALFLLGRKREWREKERLFIATFGRQFFMNKKKMFAEQIINK
jgi:hypothetical protein